MTTVLYSLTNISDPATLSDGHYEEALLWAHWRMAYLLAHGKLKIFSMVCISGLQGRMLTCRFL